MFISITLESNLSRFIYILSQSSKGNCELSSDNNKPDCVKLTITFTNYNNDV